MKKKFITIILTLCLTLTLVMPASGAMSLSNFERVRTYSDAYGDVPEGSWYFSAVRSMYERGIMNGKGGGVFDPSGTLSIAETITLAAVLHKGYHTGSTEFEAGSPWYAPYVKYALANGIPVGAYKHMNAAATRSDFAMIIGGAMPDEAVTPMNRVTDGAIPDVFESYSYGQAVYRLYRAGVLTGADKAGTYYPGRTLTRVEAAVILARLVDANERVSFTLVTELTAEEIYKLASPAVFFVEAFDSEGEPLKTGSGFFISETGEAVTNYHVVIGADTVRITTDSGEVFDVVGIYDYNWKEDTALIQVGGDNFPYLETADSSAVQTGATVYTLGSPLGLQASFTKGIISRSIREVEGTVFIQLDAPISSGSSGGALLDSFGRAIGVTSATMNESQNINLAVPINLFTELSRETITPLSKLLLTSVFYEGFYPTPDFGAYFDIEIFDEGTSRSGTSFSYLISELPGSLADVLEEYSYLLEQNQFESTNLLSQGEDTQMVYYNVQHSVLIIISTEIISGRDCITLTLS